MWDEGKRPGLTTEGLEVAAESVKGECINKECDPVPVPTRE